MFVPKSRNPGKVLLIIDDHGSHMTLDVIDFVRENNSAMFAPSHYTHIATTRYICIFTIEKLFF